MTIQSAKTKTRPRNANLIDVDPDDGVETFHLEEQPRMPCRRCPGDKWRVHALYLEVGGDNVVTARCFRVCRACQLETEGQPGEIGKVR